MNAPGIGVHTDHDRLDARARTRRSLFAWITACCVVVLGLVALRLAFAAGDSASSSAFVTSSVLLAVIWIVGGVLLVVIHGPDDEARRAGRARATASGLLAGAAIGLATLLGGVALMFVPQTQAWVLDALRTATAAPQTTVLIVALIAGMGEEVFFRIGLIRLLHGWTRWVFPAALYTAVTVATGNLGLVLVAPLLSVVATAGWIRTGRWLAPLAVHAVWTLVMVGLFPILAAGMGNVG